MIFFYLLVWVLPLVNHPIWGAKVGPITVFEYVGIVCMLFVLFRIYASRKIPRLLGSWTTRCVFLLYLVAVVSTVATSSIGISLANSIFVQYTSTIFLFVITLALVDTVERFRWTVLCLVGSYAWASLYLIREWQVGVDLGSDGRPGWIVGDSNFFATSAIYAIALGICFIQAKRPRWERIYCLICILITLFGVTLCASRGAFLGLAAACLLILWRMPHRFRNFAFIMVLVVPLSIFLPVSPVHRFLHPTIAETDSEEAHKEAWDAGGRMIEAHPVFGVGLGNFKPLMPEYVLPGQTVDTIAHNMFIEIAAELGIPTLFVFVGIFIASYVGLNRIRKSENVVSVVRESAIGLQASLVGIMVAGSFVSAEYEKTTWMGIALIASLINIVQLQRSSKRAVERVRHRATRDEIPAFVSTRSA
jgi:putative inorganic carbon (HCO3(-)) transporter